MTLMAPFRKPFGQLLFGAVFDRHPKLQVVFAEGGIAWVPAALQDAEVLYDTFGNGDIIDYVLGLLLFLLAGACATCGVALLARVADADKAAAYRPVLVGMTTFVLYYLVHPHVGPAVP